ncbi:MAG TPA: hypothetical protein PLQ54_16305, partial [Armatimonadota bacterium]|nr:hypothetical protein [Armatimonadota bacterium]
DHEHDTTDWPLNANRTPACAGLGRTLTKPPDDFEGGGDMNEARAWKGPILDGHVHMGDLG